MADEWPLPAFYFSVVIGNNQDDSAFQEISGLEAQIDTEDYQEGGNNLVYHLPKVIKHSNLTLKRGIADSSSALVKWCQDTLEAQLSKAIVPKRSRSDCLMKKALHAGYGFSITPTPLNGELKGSTRRKMTLRLKKLRSVTAEQAAQNSRSRGD